MTLQNITVNTVNNSDLYFLKADGTDFIQAPISETTHIGVLRYAPTEAGLYQGEVYTNASALKQYQKFPVSLTVLNVLTVDVFVSITDPSDDPDYAGWFQVGKGLPVVGTSFGLLDSDVSVGTDIWVMVRDSVNAGVYDIAQSGVMSLVLTSPSAGTSFVYRSDITVEWEASANITLVNIVIQSATGIRTVSNIDASLGTYDVPMIADSGSFDFGQELVITVENSLQTIADSVTVEIRQATLQDFRIERSESEYRVAEDIHFTAYVNYGNLPNIYPVYVQYSADGITYEDIKSATGSGSGLANITGCLIPAGASGTIYLRARVGDVYSDPIEALVVVPEIVISAVDVTLDEAFTISGTCNLAKNLRISYAKDPYSSWTVVDNSVAVQPNGTWSVEGVVISETGNFRLKAEYIQDTVSMFSDIEDVVVASGVGFLTTIALTTTGTGRVYAGMALSGTKLSIFGGGNASGNLATNNTATADESDLTSWSAGITGHPQSRLFAYCNIGDVIFSVSGLQGTSNGIVSTNCFSGNPSTSTNWSSYTSGGFARQGSAFTVSGNRFYVAGGNNSGIYYNQVRSLSSGSWVTNRNDGDANGFTKSGYASMVADSSGNLYYLGGFDGTSWLNKVWKSTNSGASWTELAQTGTGFGNRGTAVAWFKDGYIYIIGGYDGTNALATCFKSSNGQDWEEVTIINTEWTARYGVSGAMGSDGCFYVYGGYDGSTYFDELYKVT